MDILVRVENYNVSNLVLALCILSHVTRYSNVTASLFPQPQLLAEAIITLTFVIRLCNAEYRQSVPSKKPVLHQLGLCSINLKPNCTFSCTVTI